MSARSRFPSAARPTRSGPRRWPASLIGAALASTFACGSAHAACQPELRSAPTAPRVDYEVYAFSRAIGSTELSVHNAGDMECELEVFVRDLTDAPPPFAFARAGVDIDVIAPGLERPGETLSERGRFTLRLAPGTSRTVQLDFLTDQAVSVPAGRYVRDIEIGVARAGAIDAFETFVTDLSVISASQAQINIAGADGVFDKATYTDSIDFGEAEVGATRRVFVQARANAPSRITLRSDNGGVMRHSGSRGSTIAYKAELDGITIDLSSPFVVPNVSETGLDGRSQPLDLTLTGLDNAFSGRYTDRIVIEIEAE